MKKISTLFAKAATILARAINKLNAENVSLISGEIIASRKFDVQSSAISDGELYKRFCAKNEDTIPANERSCQEAALKNKINKTYELHGTKQRIPNYQNYGVLLKFPRILKKIYYHEQYIKRIQKSD
ncbi:hypothetical protein IRZ83_12865 [Flavobacterium sp. JLP]|uniref:hypothetical protein n=1 Tax=Flavobacterium sp. JLP TaxID=2783793 RepID=UPI00188CFDEB|nr:hypothetical protein [Flavobacterium sp. JLP]MBF4507561.1 hypothetical protein [Flavobacterium sp. JLP]